MRQGTVRELADTQQQQMTLLQNTIEAEQTELASVRKECELGKEDLSIWENKYREVEELLGNTVKDMQLLSVQLQALKNETEAAQQAAEESTARATAAEVHIEQLQQKLQVLGMGNEQSQDFMQNSQSIVGRGQLVRTFECTVLGEGTSFEEQVTVGSKICCLSQVRTVVSIAGATTLVVDKAFDPGITEPEPYFIEGSSKKVTNCSCDGCLSNPCVPRSWKQL